MFAWPYVFLLLQRTEVRDLSKLGVVHSQCGVWTTTELIFWLQLVPADTYL